MKKDNIRFIILGILLFIIGIALFIFVYLGYFQAKPISEVCTHSECFQVELATTKEEQTKGLMFRESLDLNEGMLFVYLQEARHGFWMKNTKIELDIIWINKNRKIVYIKENAQPCGENVCESIYPQEGAQYVLEINGGQCKTKGIKIGDTVIFK